MGNIYSTFLYQARSVNPQRDRVEMGDWTSHAGEAHALAAMDPQGYVLAVKVQLNDSTGETHERIETKDPRDWTEPERIALRFGWAKGQHSMMKELVRKAKSGMYPSKIENTLMPMLQERLNWTKRMLKNEPDPRKYK